MSEQMILQSVRKHINGQNNNWKFVMGRTVLTKKEFLRKLDQDKKFRSFVVELVVSLSVDILSRKGG